MAGSTKRTMWDGDERYLTFKSSSMIRIRGGMVLRSNDINFNWKAGNFYFVPLLINAMHYLITYITVTDYLLVTGLMLIFPAILLTKEPLFMKEKKATMPSTSMRFTI